MKLWLKYIAGILVGSALYLVAPKALFETGGFLRQAAGISVRIGYYAFLALVVSGLPLSVMKLSEERKFWRIALRSVAYFLVSSLVAALLGILVAQIPDIARLPLLADTASKAGASLSLRIAELFPINLGALAAYSGDLAVPLLLLAFIVGLAMAHDPAASRPVADLLDSMSRILYTINTFITEILSVLLIPITADSLNSLSTSMAGGAYDSVATIVLLGSIGIVFLVFPAFLFIATGKKNPFPFLFAFLASSLAALASGNLRFAAGTLVREEAEDMGLRRRHSSAILPLGLVFGRVGTTFVAAICSIFMLSSYSPLAGSFTNTLLMLLVVPLATMVAGAAIPGGPIGVLVLVCGIFGKGFENGYLVVAPIALLLSMAATAIDLLWIGISQVFCAASLVPAERKRSQHFI
jgi:Na+/H+-dicarboxylate symporter